ncbi:uncharacterized protein MONOS_5416 [Monocercomonoides exilis]|uniref:uncharacterized protein n=1 Tax=Monocercomonoides exilis TaxID=2049356 RepID=UPI00355998DD|nr:hypothetical protein MONOS_5416 [Monocercomonoides exilis]|eukprot:MONOS_5416.1-p1 / transcript=MONOS_5416.1 / gene=MONOS_5416 / organism=Monocercomonoides_exilis_PA203 / gene_product=unspecified product / transcript_product=unspecified product / location=Mono_scaffold00157:33913-34239(+) / protein_length=109 / sequence_SO=supercontig / SO=protein_coding / is_pseudo=false
MEDVVQSLIAIVLAVIEERKDVEGGKEGEEKGKEDGEEDGGREGGDLNEEKGEYPIAHRELVERIKEDQGKLEEANGSAGCGDAWAEEAEVNEGEDTYRGRQAAFSGI